MTEEDDSEVLSGDAKGGGVVEGSDLQVRGYTVLREAVGTAEEEDRRRFRGDRERKWLAGGKDVSMVYTLRCTVSFIGRVVSFLMF